MPVYWVKEGGEKVAEAVEEAVESSGAPITLQEIFQILQLIKEIRTLEEPKAEPVRAPPKVPEVPVAKPTGNNNPHPSGGGEQRGGEEMNVGKLDFDQILKGVRVAKVIFGDITLSELEKKLEELKQNLG